VGGLPSPGDYEDHDEGNDAEEEAEDGEQDGAVAFGFGDEPADDGGDDAADQVEDALDAAEDEPGGKGLLVWRGKQGVQHGDSLSWEWSVLRCRVNHLPRRYVS